MRLKDVIDYLSKKTAGKQGKPEKVLKTNLILDDEDQEEEEKKELVPKIEDPLIKNLSEIEIKNPLTVLDESKSTKKLRKPNKRSHYQIPGVFMMLEEDIIDEVLDGDEGIINRRLPVNQYNHQVSPRGAQKPLKQSRALGLIQSRKHMRNNFEEEEGCENCKEEDEERKEGEGQNQSVIRQIPKDHTIVFDQEL